MLANTSIFLKDCKKFIVFEKDKMLKLKDLKVNYSTEILENKIRLDVYQRENAPVEIRFNILGGDVFYTDPNKKGLAHFVEHILCAGTPK
jgi:predicted Zn-dependent peptidase